jgi:hypothetical protein
VNADDLNDFTAWTDDDYASASQHLWDSMEAMDLEGIPDPYTATKALRDSRGTLDFEVWKRRLFNATNRAIAAHNHNRVTRPTT